MAPIIPNWDDISQDSLTKFIDKYWSPYKTSNEAFDPNIIDTVYYKELKQNNFMNKKITILEFSQYLENYLIPNLRASTASLPHIMSIVIMINQKIKEGVPGLKTFETKSDLFPTFFHNFLTLLLQQKLTVYEKTQAIIFLNHAFNSLELSFVRKCVQKLVSLSTWCCLFENRREHEFKEMPKLRKIYNALMKKEAKMDEETKERAIFEKTFLYKLLQDFINLINDIDKKDTQDKEAKLNKTATITYCERFLEFLIDLEAHLPNRRFFKVILDSTHLLTYCTLCTLNNANDEQTKLFSQQLEILKFYHGFEINDLTGEALTEGEMTDIHYEQIISLQKSCFKNYRSILLKFALANVASVDTRDQLIKSFSVIDNKTLYQIGASLALLPSDHSSQNDNENSHEILAKSAQDSRFLIELLVSRHERRLSQLDAINDMPLYPTEDVLWDENLVPNEYYNGEACLALPKLNLQFLTLHDYLLRNFTLFKLETTFEIRKDIEDAITRMKPWRSEDGKGCLFGGWARMALAITSFTIMDVGKPALGEKRPSRVRAEVTVNLNVTDEVKQEWEALRRHDICFLICVRPERSFGTQHDRKKAFKTQVGLTYVRGCEIEGMLDVDGKIVEEGPKAKEAKLPQGAVRTWRVYLDTNQYAIDMATKSAVQSSADSEIPFLEAYDGFNVLLRRKPKENNFKAVLETIRDIMNVPPKWAQPEDPSGVEVKQEGGAEDHVTGDAAVLPSWLHDLMLGYGEPDSASYTKVLPNLVKVQPSLAGLDADGFLDFRDTFLDQDHILQSFPKYSISYAPLDRGIRLQEGVTPFYKLKFSNLPIATNTQEMNELDDVDSSNMKIEVKEYQVETIGPYQRPTNVKRNLVRFTPTQVSAIKSGILPGLTMVVGPPGTGKTDLAVQIVSTLYHAHPLQRTLLVTHSNQALNQLFEKISRLDIDERHLLRLGHGEEGLDLEGKDFSKYGRVDFVLSRRLSLLARVRSLQLSLLDPCAEQEANKPQNVQGIRSLQALTKRQREALEEEEENMELVDSEIPDPTNLPENYEEMEQEEEIVKENVEKNVTEITTDQAIDEEVPLALKDTDPTPLNRDSIILSAHRVQNPFTSGNQPAPTLGASYFATADVSYTCETALYFYRYEVLSRWEKFKVEITPLVNSHKAESDDEQINRRIIERFPFTRFFQDLGRPLFDTSASYVENMKVAESCFKFIKNIFDQLEEFRAFELLRNGADRVKYLLIREAKIIAMTCTHAALRRGDLIAAGFKYDNILIEEAAQILEIESFIPLLLQNNEDGVNRLKRWIMIGDHNQLPPVIKNMAFKKYSNMEQSMFTRFIRLGVPAYHLDAQGRAKPSLCRLYDWRYQKLGNLPHTMRDPEYLLANAGFAFDTQLINVEDFNGVGETEPSPYFYQNLAEAEFVVATFTYMRLLGYPAEKITILTTYNGQKHLIRDVIRRRCGENPLIGWPSKVTTVDRFQGQQNDYVLLSLVKTRNIGHVRDVRRLVVAMSRARLGLYIFARVSLFGRCFELTPVFKLLRNTPILLHLYPQEKFPGVRPINTQPLGVAPYVIQDMPHMSNFVYQFYQERLKQIQALPNPNPAEVTTTNSEKPIEPKTSQKLALETEVAVDLKNKVEDDKSNPFASSVSTSIIEEAPQSDIVESDTSSSTSDEE